MPELGSLPMKRTAFPKGTMRGFSASFFQINKAMDFYLVADLFYIFNQPSNAESSTIPQD
jgi:hypothetical protein